MKIQFAKPERLFLQSAVAAVASTIKGLENVKENWPKYEALKRLHNQLSPESAVSTLGGDDVSVLKQIVDTAQAHLKVAEQRTLTEEQKVRLLALTETYSSVSIKLNQGTAQKEESNGSSN